MTTWLMLSPSMPGRFDGIGDNAWRLGRELSQHGHVDLIARVRRSADGISGAPPPGAPPPDDPGAPQLHRVPSWRALGSREWRDRARHADGVIIHYFPPAFLHRDLASLLRWISSLGRRGIPVVLTAHELWPPSDGRLRRVGLRATYRRVLALLLRRIDRVVVSYEDARRELTKAGLSAGRDVRVIPVGSAIDPQPGAPTAPDEEIIATMFGQPAGMHTPTLVALGTWLDTTPRPVRICWIGRSISEMRSTWIDDLHLPTRRITFEGGLAAEDISARLGRSSIGLAPYVDGVSTRRSSLAALIAHRLPLVGLDGFCTDAVLRESGAFALSPLTTPEAFVRHLDELTGDPARRQLMARSTARFFDAHLSWPQIARQYLDIF